MKKFIFLVVFCVTMISCVSKTDRQYKNYKYKCYVVIRIDMLYDNFCMYHLKYDNGQFIDNFKAKGIIGMYQVGEIVKVIEK